MGAKKANKLLWNGACGWSGKCMSMLEVVSFLEMKVGSIRTPYSVPCSASLCWRNSDGIIHEFRILRLTFCGKSD